MENQICNKLSTELEVCMKQPSFNVGINVCKDVTDKHQFIYASQLYDTFFALFCRLHTENGMLEAIYLKLINYKGDIKLGMLPATESSWGNHHTGHKIELHLRANDSCATKGFDDELKITCPDNTKLCDLNSLFIDRKLYQMYDGVSTIDQLKQEVFDTEFYVKDGALVVKKPNLDDMVDAHVRTQYNKALKENSDLTYEEFQILLDPRVCKTSFVSFV